MKTYVVIYSIAFGNGRVNHECEVEATSAAHAEAVAELDHPEGLFFRAVID